MKLVIKRLMGLYGVRYFYVTTPEGLKLSGGWSTLEKAMVDMKKMRRLERYAEAR